MKRRVTWIKTEYKRAAALLPSCLLWAFFLAVLAAAAVFFVRLYLSGHQKKPLARIGYAVSGDAGQEGALSEDALTGFAVSYIENMASFKGLYELLPVDGEEGKRQVAERDLTALLLLPENVMGEILSGSNAPATLYVPSKATPAGLLFEELAGAGIGMLRTAQAEIYATHALASGNGEALADLNTYYGEIDKFNLRLVMNREQFFGRRVLSATGSAGMTVYYGSAAFALGLILFGFFAGRYLRRTGTESGMLAVRAGIPPAAQTLGKTAALSLVLILFAAVLLSVCMLPGVRDILGLRAAREGILPAVLSCVLAAVWIQLLYLAAGSRHTVFLLLGVTTIVQGYLAGCFIPTPLLPGAAQRLSYLCPATWIKGGFTVLFAGGGQSGRTLAGIAGSLVLWRGLSVLAAHKALRRADRGGDDSAKRYPRGGSAKYRISLFAILGKRMLCQKSLWAVLILTVLVSKTVTILENHSETSVRALLYDESGRWKELFSAYDGLVEFDFADSEDELVRNVMRGYAECGYVLQEDLQEKILSGEGSREITVYENADSTLTALINEIVFERIFYGISTEWFEGYIAEKNWGVSEREIGAALMESLGDGSTFSYQKKYVECEGDGVSLSEKRSLVSAYPARAVAVAGILLCAALGVADAWADRRAHRFYKCSAIKTSLITILQPVMAGAFVALLLWYA